MTATITSSIRLLADRGDLAAAIRVALAAEPLIKAGFAKPPGGGWQAVPNSKSGGMRRQHGSGWEYWYPSAHHALADHVMAGRLQSTGRWEHKDGGKVQAGAAQYLQQSHGLDAGKVQQLASTSNVVTSDDGKNLTGITTQHGQQWRTVHALGEKHAHHVGNVQGDLTGDALSSKVEAFHEARGKKGWKDPGAVKLGGHVEGTGAAPAAALNALAVHARQTGNAALASAVRAAMVAMQQPKGGQTQQQPTQATQQAPAQLPAPEKVTAQEYRDRHDDASMEHVKARDGHAKAARAARAQGDEVAAVAHEAASDAHHQASLHHLVAKDTKKGRDDAWRETIKANAATAAAGDPSAARRGPPPAIGSGGQPTAGAVAAWRKQQTPQLREAERAANDVVARTRQREADAAEIAKVNAGAAQAPAYDRQDGRLTEVAPETQHAPAQPAVQATARKLSDAEAAAEKAADAHDDAYERHSNARKRHWDAAEEAESRGDRAAAAHHNAAGDEHDKAAHLHDQASRAGGHGGEEAHAQSKKADAASKKADVGLKTPPPLNDGQPDPKSAPQPPATSAMPAAPPANASVTAAAPQAASPAPPKSAAPVSSAPAESLLHPGIHLSPDDSAKFAAMAEKPTASQLGVPRNAAFAAQRIAKLEAHEARNGNDPNRRQDLGSTVFPLIRQAAISGDKAAKQLDNTNPLGWQPKQWAEAKSLLVRMAHDPQHAQAEHVAEAAKHGDYADEHAKQAKAAHEAGDRSLASMHERAGKAHSDARNAHQAAVSSGAGGGAAHRLTMDAKSASREAFSESAKREDAAANHTQAPAQPPAATPPPAAPKQPTPAPVVAPRAAEAPKLARGTLTDAEQSDFARIAQKSSGRTPETHYFEHGGYVPHLEHAISNVHVNETKAKSAGASDPVARDNALHEAHIEARKGLLQSVSVDPELTAAFHAHANGKPVADHIRPIMDALDAVREDEEGRKNDQGLWGRIKRGLMAAAARPEPTQRHKSNNDISDHQADLVEYMMPTEQAANRARYSKGSKQSRRGTLAAAIRVYLA